MTDPQDPFAAPEPGSSPAPPPLPPYGTPAQPEQPPYGAPAYGAPPYGAPAYGEPVPYGAPGQGRRNGLGIAALVLGIASLLCLFGLLVPAVLAIVFGVIGRRRAARHEATNGGVALAGIITGTIGLVLGIAVWAFFIANWDAIKRFSDCDQAAGSNTVAQQDCSDQLEHDLFGTDPSR
jgi:hypothetical protein